MLNVVVVQVGNYCGRGGEYVKNLIDGFARHSGDTECKFWCVTDDPLSLPLCVEAISAEQNIKGWWNKLSLFKPGQFPAGERVLYFDLDQVIIGDMSDIAAHDEHFAIARDFYQPLRMNSSIMSWEAGKYDFIWTTWDNCRRPQWDKRGDQFWIETMLRDSQTQFLQDIYPGQIVSYKSDCVPLGGIPPGARIIAHHGQPRPHEVPEFYNQTPS